MNERIEQLLEQARAECFRFGSKPATTVGYDELEKFAELIVKDCASVVDGVYKAGGNTYSNLIYERFGIKYNWQK